MPETILIVDDALGRLRLTEYAVGHKLGYHAVIMNGDDAARWLLSGRQPQPDLVLLDLSVPEMDGLQLVHDIRTSCPAPVIALVAYGDDMYAARAVLAGVNDFLYKPVTLERLKLSLSNALALARLRQIVARMEWRGNGFSADGKLHAWHDGLPLKDASLLFDGHGCIRTLHSIEQEVIRLALHYHNGCMTRAARQLGIGRSTMYRRISELGREDQISRENQATRPMMVVSSAERS